MSPTFLENAFVFAIKHPFQSFKKKDVVLVDHPQYGKMIKRVAATSNYKNQQGLWLMGDNPTSVSTEKMGIISNNCVIGKVIGQIKPT